MTITKVAESAATTPANVGTFTTPVTVTQPGTLLVIAVGVAPNSVTQPLDTILTFDGGSALPIVYEAGDRTDTGGQARRAVIYTVADATVGQHSVAVRWSNGQTAGWTVSTLELAGVDLGDPFSGAWVTDYQRTATSAQVSIAALPSVAFCGTRSVETPLPIGPTFATEILNGTNQWWSSAFVDSGDVAGIQFGAGDAASRVVATAAPLRAAGSVVNPGWPVKVRQGGVFVNGALRVMSGGSFVTPANVSVITGSAPPSPDLLSWAPPVLDNPITVNITNSNRKPTLDPTRDYIINLPSTPIRVASGIEINGGRNVVLIGGEINFDTDYTNGIVTDLGSKQRAIYIKGNSSQTVPRTVHIEGVRISGANIYEGINVDSVSEPGLTVRIQNVSVEVVHTHLTGSSHEGGDVIQVWNGPLALEVDKLSCYNNGYQGVFLQPFQFGTGPVGTYTFRRVSFDGSAYVAHSGTGDGTNTSSYLLWSNSPTLNPVVTDRVHLVKNPSKSWPDGVIWPKDNNVTWGAIQGLPPEGHFVLPNDVGIGYVTPGYAA